MKKMVLPTIALRGMTVLPDMVIHFDINRKKSIHAVEKAMQTNETIFLLTQKDIDTANPVQDDLYSVGTVAKVKELIKLPKGIVRVLVAGKYKGMVNTVSESDGMLISDIVTDRDWFLAPDNLTQIAMIRSLNELICRYAAVNQRFSKDILKEWLIAKNLQEKVKKILADYPVDYTVKQKFLEMSDVNEIYEQLARMFIEDINIFDIKKELEDGIKEKVEKNQKEYYLREQLKYINEELDGTDGSSEIDEYMEKLESLNAADEIKEQIESLSAVNQAQRQLLGSLAHELKTPMTAIIGYADTLLTVRLSKERQERALTYIGNECRRLSRLSVKMLELTGLYETGESQLTLQEVPVADFLDEAQKLTLYRLQEKNLHLEISCNPENLKKTFDKDLMLSVVTNFIDNAVKASEENSRILLHATNDRLTVQDFGKGIPPEDLSKVTDAFYMVDKSRSRANGSVGLGLSLCQKIADLHGYQMKIESTVGEGTKVSVLW